MAVIGRWSLAKVFVNPAIIKLGSFFPISFYLLIVRKNILRLDIVGHTCPDVANAIRLVAADSFLL